MIKVAVATISPDEIRGIRNAFLRSFYNITTEIEFRPVNVETGAPSYPVGDEIYLNALNRVKNAREKYPGMDYYISCKDGIECAFGEYFNIHVVCILHHEEVFWGKSSGWNIPIEDMGFIGNKSPDIYLIEKRNFCIEEMLVSSHSRSKAVAQATELALISGKLRNN